MTPEKIAMVRAAYGIPGRLDEAGFYNSDSITDTAPKIGPQISPEVQQMFQAMQINMIAREQRLVEAFTKKEPKTD